MAARMFWPLTTSMPEIEAVPFYLTTDATGAPTLAGDGGGRIASVSSPASGRYRLNLTHKYSTFWVSLAQHSGSPSAATVKDYANAVTAATPYVELCVGNASYPLVGAGGFPHQAGTTPTLVTAANASDLATLKTLCQDLCLRVQAHDDDTNIHPAADTGALAVAAWASTPGLPADLTECQAILNEIKSDWNTHAAKIDATGVVYHTGDDLRNLITNANATNQATSETLANEIKAKFNASVQAKPATGTEYCPVISGTIRGILFLSR